MIVEITKPDIKYNKKLRRTIYPAAAYCLEASANGDERMFDTFQCVYVLIGMIYEVDSSVEVSIDDFDDDGYTLIISGTGGTEIFEIDHSMFSYSKYLNNNITIDMSYLVTLPTWYTKYVKPYEINIKCEGKAKNQAESQ
jgi:hypothetical protein